VRVQRSTKDCIPKRASQVRLCAGFSIKRFHSKRYGNPVFRQYTVGTLFAMITTLLDYVKPNRTA
jgi:hypothetical protein